MDLQLKAWVDSTVHAVVKHWLSCKEKVPAAAVNEESYADSVLEHERIYDYWFPWKRCNDKVSYCQLYE